MRFTGPRTWFSMDLRALATFRVGMALLLIIDLIMRSSDLAAHYTNFGILPVGPYVDQFANRLHISLHLANGEAGWQIFLFGLAALAALAVLVGYKTRAATIITWVLLVSLHNRNTMILNGGDVLFRLLWFWAMFLPLNRRWSVDAAMSTSAPQKENRFFGGPTIGLTGQILCIYIATACLKTGREWFPDGTASYYALSLDQFTTSFGVWMLQWYDLLWISTYIVYALEVSAAILLMSPICFPVVRTLTIAALMFMHLNFDLTMRLGLFPWVDIVALIPLLPTEVWDRIARFTKSEARTGMKLYYDADCGFCKRMVLLIRTFLLEPETQILPAQGDAGMAKVLADEHSWIVVDATGKQFVRFAAVTAVLQHVPFFGLIFRRLPLGVFGRWGDSLYRFVARHRSTLGKVTSRVLPYKDLPDIRPGWLLNFVTLFFIAYIVLWNAKSIPKLGVTMLSPWDRLGSVLRLDQTWNMFAPYPLKDDGWYVIDGTLRDDSKADVLAGTLGAVTYDKPALVSMQHANARWRKYLMNLTSKRKKSYRLYYGKYLCRQWNATHPYSQQLMRFEFVFMKEKTRPVGEPQPTERVSLWHHDCFKKSDDGSGEAPQQSSPTWVAPSSSPEPESSNRPEPTVDDANAP